LSDWRFRRRASSSAGYSGLVLHGLSGMRIIWRHLELVTEVPAGLKELLALEEE
jgi:hypothetical protein